MKILAGLTAWTRFKQAVPDAQALIQVYIDEHKKSFQSDNYRDYMDVYNYIQEIYNTQDVHSLFYQKAGGGRHFVIPAG